MRFNIFLKYLFLFVFPIFTSPLFSQSSFANLSADSLNKLAEQIKRISPDSALQYAFAANTKSKTDEDSVQEAISHRNIGMIYFMMADYKNAEKSIRQAIRIAQEINNDDFYADYNNILGYINAQQGEYTVAAGFMIKALEIFQQTNNMDGLISTCTNIGLVHYYMENFDKASHYMNMALKYTQTYKDYKNIASIYHNLGLVYNAVGKNDSAVILYKKALVIKEKRQNKYGMYSSLNAIAISFLNKDQLDSALVYYRRARIIAQEVSDKSLLASSSINIGQVELKRNNLKKALEMVDAGIKLAEEVNVKEWSKIGYVTKKDIYEAQKDYKNAISAYEQYVQIKDSLNGEETKNRVAELEAKYESEKKDKKIELLSKENQIHALEMEKKNATIKTTVLLAVLIILVLLFVLLYSRKRQKIKQLTALQKSQDKILKMERKILSSIIETEDKERKRFAEDIHDEVNPLLSSIKLYLGEIKYAEGEDKIQMLDFANELTTEAIHQVREISHNIMPDLLTKEGLFVSLEKFIEKIRFTKNLNITLVNRLRQTSLNQNLELILFRIIKELINNTIKHAKATNIKIIFEQKGDTLNVSYEDNGIGFDWKKVKEKKEKGIGLSNIQNRISSINGKCNINSKEGEGMQVLIQIEV